jgi:hypothetical protein
MRVAKNNRILKKDLSGSNKALVRGALMDQCVFLHSVENSAQVLSCQLKFAHAASN